MTFQVTVMTKGIKLLDAETTVKELLQHIVVNFLYGFLNGLVIAAVVIGSAWLIAVAYISLKQVESKVLNRNKYTSTLGKNIIFPIPSTLGFLLGWWISTIIKNSL